MRLTPLLDGAPNFRQVPDLPVYGVAIPTVSGVRRVLDTLGAWKGRRKVLWHNMREEPVIYINGRPYVVREADKPFANLEYTGINGERVEDMEARLKQDVLAEAGKYNGAVMVAHEDDEFQVIQEWEPVSEVDVQTPLEVYEELKSMFGWLFNLLLTVLCCAPSTASSLTAMTTKANSTSFPHSLQRKVMT